jgi:hypothetical protein
MINNSILLKKLLYKKIEIFFKYKDKILIF